MAFAGGMSAQPADLPTTMPDGKTPLQGMSYIYGPDGRSTVHRTWNIHDPYGYSSTAQPMQPHPVDIEAAGCDLEVWRQRRAGTVPDEDPKPEPSAAAETQTAPPAGEKPREAPIVRRWQLIADAVGEGPTTLQAIFEAAGQWDVPASMKTISNDLVKMCEAGVLHKPGGQRGVYAKGPDPASSAA